MANYGVDIEISVKGQNQLRSLEQQITSLADAAKKVTTFDVSGATKQTTSELEIQRRLYQESGKERRNNLVLANRELQVEQLINDKLNKRVEIQKSQEQARGRLESLALGAGFPLLFGGGLGAVGGGIAGSFVGQGFGGQILLSAIGQQLDTFTAGVAQLGQALDPLTADLDLVIQKTGLTGTATADYIKKLEDAGDATAALEVATTELSYVVGKDGVNALKNFGDQTQELSNQFSKLFTQIGASLASLLEGPVTALVNYLDTQTAVTGALTSTDPTLKNLAEQYSNIFVPSGFEDFPIFASALAEQEKILSQIKARQKEIADEERRRLETLKEINVASQADLNLLDRQIDLAIRGNDLTDEAVYAAKRKVIEGETYVKLQNAINKGLETETILREETLKYILLDKQRQEAIARAQEAQTKELQRQQEEQDRIRKQQLDQFRAALRIYDVELQKLKLTKAATEQGRLTAEYELKRADIVRALSIDLDKAVTTAERLALTRAAQIAGENAYLTYIKDQNSEFYKQVGLTQTIDDRTRSIASNLASAFQLDMDLTGVLTDGTLASELERVRSELEKLLNPVNQVSTAAAGIGEAFSNSFTSAIDGSVSAQQAIADLFKGIAASFLDMASQLIKKYIEMQFIGLISSFFPTSFGFKGAGPYSFGQTVDTTAAGFAAGLNLLPGKASGGPVSAGSSYIVGEKGPELFTPKSSGMIIPNDALGGMGGGSVVVNVDAKGSTVEGNGNQAKALGAAIGAAVQAEIIKQKKPGGLLY